MNSQLSLALLVTFLCLSKAAQPLDGANSGVTELLQQIKSNKTVFDALRRLFLKVADNHTSSQPVISQTTTKGTSTKPLLTTQPLISQPTVATASSKPWTSTQPVATQTTTKGTSTKPLLTTQPLISQPTVATASSKPWTSTQPVATQTTTKGTSTKPLSTTQTVDSQTTTNSNVSRNDNNTSNINTTEDDANSDVTELIQQIKGNKAVFDALRRLILKMADDHTSSEGTSTPTQPVISQTTTKETSTKPFLTTQPLISQPTDTTASSKPWTSTQPVATQTTTKENSTKPLSTMQPVDSQTTTNSNVSRNDNNTSNINTTEGENQDQDTNKFESFQLSHHSSNFPVFFMLILLILVAGYFAYHNRNKIHRFIKEGYGKAKQTGTAYVKVKLEDDIDIELRSEANRQYVY